MDLLEKPGGCSGALTVGFDYKKWKEAVGLGAVAAPIPVTSCSSQTSGTASQNPCFTSRISSRLDTLIVPSDNSFEITP